MVSFSRAKPVKPRPNRSSKNVYGQMALEFSRLFAHCHPTNSDRYWNSHLL